MWEFSGNIEYQCNECSYTDTIPVKDFCIEVIGSSERSMGQETAYELVSEIQCHECQNNIELIFTVYEYPIGAINYIGNESKGAITSSEPDIQHLEEIYNENDFTPLIPAIELLMREVKEQPELLRTITPREFEKVVCEIFKSKDFEVELTPSTRDRGKDIIAISSDSLGIKNKYFIECKRYSEDNKVDVSVIRSLYGVKHTKDGPNKTILVTTSSFTQPAKDFAKIEAQSTWDMTLIDYEQLLKWIQDYP